MLLAGDRINIWRRLARTYVFWEMKMEKTLSVYLEPECFSGEQTRAKPEIFADIFDRFYKRIYNYMRYRLNSQDEAEELTSQVFEQVLLKYQTFCPERAPFEVWLFSIAHHTVTDYFRKQKKRVWFSLESFRNQASREPTPYEAALRSEEHNLLIAALATLEERERNIIAMRFAGGLKNREIARLTGLSESNVGVILYRSLHQLKKTLKSKGWDNERV